MTLKLRRIYEYMNEFIDEEHELTNEQSNLILNASTDIGMVIMQLENANA